MISWEVFDGGRGLRLGGVRLGLLWVVGEAVQIPREVEAVSFSLWWRAASCRQDW